MADMKNVVWFDKKRIEKGISDLVGYLTFCKAPAALIELTKFGAENYYKMNESDANVSFAIHARDLRGVFEQRLGLVKDDVIVPFGYISSSPMNMSIHAALQGRTARPTPDGDAARALFDEHLQWMLRDSGINDAFVYLTAMLRTLLDHAAEVCIIDEDDPTKYPYRLSKTRHYMAMYVDPTPESTGEILTITFCEPGFDYNAENS